MAKRARSSAPGSVACAVLEHDQDRPLAGRVGQRCGHGPEAGEALRLQVVRGVLIVEELRGVAPAQLSEDLLPRPHRRRAPVGPARAPRRRPVAAGGARHHFLRRDGSSRCPLRPGTDQPADAGLDRVHRPFDGAQPPALPPKGAGTVPARGEMRAMECHSDVTPYRVSGSAHQVCHGPPHRQPRRQSMPDRPRRLCEWQGPGHDPAGERHQLAR